MKIFFADLFSIHFVLFVLSSLNTHLDRSTALAATFAVDSDHTTVAFKIRHMVSKVTGKFTQFDGVIDYEPDHLAQSKFTGEIQVKSIDTSNKKRDEHLKSPDFFDEKKFPTMKFVSTEVTQVNGNKAKVHGDFTLHGVTKPIVLDFEFLGQAKDPWGNQRLGATASGKINRKDFGLTWNKALETGGLLVGDDVELALDIEAMEKSATDTRTHPKSAGKSRRTENKNE